MICKFCNSELEDGSVICPVCGSMLTEESEMIGEAIEDMSPEEMILPEMPQMELLLEDASDAQSDVQDEPESVIETKRGRWKLPAIIAGCVLLVCALAAIVLSELGIEFNFRNRENNVHYKESYTVKDSVAKRKANDVVATVGNMELTNDELQVHYWALVSSTLSHSGYNLTQPLDELLYSKDENLTWQQYFLDTAIGNWRWYATLYQMAIEDDADVDYAAMYQSKIDEWMESLTTTAVKYGYESADAMIKADIGAGVSSKGHAQYMVLNEVVNSYYGSIYKSINPTMEQIEEFFAANEATYAQNGIKKDSGKLVDVRHILLKPESDTQEAWDACYAKAEALLTQWQNGEATEASFGELANANSADPGSNTKGGLYTGVPKGYMVEAFDGWIFDESRESGNTGIVKTQHGYHIMYFVDSQDAWVVNAREDFIVDQIYDMIDAAYEKWPMDVNYKKIILSEMSF